MHHEYVIKTECQDVKDDETHKLGDYAISIWVPDKVFPVIM